MVKLDSRPPLLLMVMLVGPAWLRPRQASNTDSNTAAYAVDAGEKEGGGCFEA